MGYLLMALGLRIQVIGLVKEFYHRLYKHYESEAAWHDKREE